MNQLDLDIKKLKKEISDISILVMGLANTQINKNNPEILEVNQKIQDIFASISQLKSEVIESDINIKQELSQELINLSNRLKDIENEEIIEVKDGYTPRKGVDYFDGIDGKTPTKQELEGIILPLLPVYPTIDEFLSKVPPQIEIPIETADGIIERINQLPIKANLQIDFSHIKNFPKQDNKMLVGNRIFAQLADVSFSNLQNGDVPIWNSTRLRFENGPASGGAITSVSNTDGTLTISPTTGAVIASLNLAHANTWTGTQTFSVAPVISGFTQNSVIFAGAGGVLSQDNPNFFYDPSIGQLRIGPANSDFTPENRLAVSGNANDYFGICVENASNGSVASTDIVVSNDLGTATGNYADFGVNSSGNTNPAFTAFAPSDVYLFTSGSLNNLVIANGTVGKRIDFVLDGTLSSNRVASFTSTGLGIGTTAPSVLLDVRKDATGATPTTNLLLENQTAATSSVLQYSPALQFTGSNWYSTGGAQAGVAMSRMYMKPFNAANPQGATILAGNITGQGNPFPGAFIEDYWFYHGQSNGSAPTGGTYGGLRVPTGIQFNNGATAGIYASLGMGQSSAAGGYGVFAGTTAGFAGTGNTNTVQLGMSSSFNYTTTAGIQNIVALGGNLVTPSASTAIWSVLNWAGTINQFTGSTGITRGIFFNPILTAATDFRYIDFQSNGVQRIKIDQNGITTGPTDQTFQIFSGVTTATTVSTPGQNLNLVAASALPGSASGLAAGGTVNITAGNSVAPFGGNVIGGAINISAGNAPTNSASAASGGSVNITAGTSGIANNGAGGSVVITSGTVLTPPGGGANNQTGGISLLTASPPALGSTNSGFGAGAISLVGGNGASNTLSTTSNTSTNKFGGSIVSTAGNGGAAINTALGTNGQVGGSGGGYSWTAGTGGATTATSGTGTQTAGAGGGFNITLGVGGATSGLTGGTSTAGSSGNFTVTGGSGGATSGTGTNVAGNGSSFNLTTGNGGNSTGASGSRTGGNSGSFNFTIGTPGTGATANGVNGDFNFTNGNIKILTVGNGIYLKEGTNAVMGIGTLVAGTLTINTIKVTANSRIFLTDIGGTITNLGFLYVSARVAGTSFTVSSSNVLDASNFNWVIIEPS